MTVGVTGALGRLRRHALGGGRTGAAIRFGASLLGVCAVAVLAYKHASPFTALIEAVNDGERLVMSALLDRQAYLKWAYGRYVYDAEWIDRVHPTVAATDVASLIAVRSPEAVERTRRKLLDLIWHGRGMPLDRMPDSVERGISDEAFAGLKNVARMDRLKIRLAHGAVAVPYVFYPKRPARGVLIYHQGHYGHFTHGIPAIDRFLADGYVVLGLSMPMLGPNRGPDLDIPRYGRLDLHTHNVLQFFQTESFNPLTFFLDPILISVNYLLKTTGERCAAMVGVSTGGWLTTFAAALDTRICYSYPVAGSLPAYVRMQKPNVPNVGDYEEMRPEVMTIANVLDFYVLAAAGRGRAHIAIYNQFDNCCYRGIGATTFREPVRAAVAQSGGGAFDVHIDSTFIGHKVSPYAAELILKDLDARRSADRRG